MNSKPGLTLNDIRKSPRVGQVHRASDFLTKEEREKLHRSNFMGKRSKKKFDATDAYCAEIIARFGYEVYKAWDKEEIDPKFMRRMVEAERARERANWLPLETIVINMVGSCIKRQKGEKAPKGPKAAQKVMKNEVKIAKGEA